MTQAASRDNDQAVYWNEDGGQRWVRHMEGVEGMLAGMSEVLLARVAARPGERALDVGCGGGVTSAALAAAVGAHGHVVGLDVSKIILDVARPRFATIANLEFVLADASNHTFVPASFDLICSRFGVMFFHAPAAAFANLRQAARSGARLVFLCWRRLDENPWMAVAAQAAFTVIAPPPKPAPGTPGPFSFASQTRVSEILIGAGFADLEFEAIDQPITLGTPEQALEWLTYMGPAAQPLREAANDAREAARAAMRAALAAHALDDQVVLNGATWLVSARAA